MIDVTGLDTSQEMLDYILDSYGFKSEPYFVESVVKVGYGHTVPKTWLIKDKSLTREEAASIFLKDLKKIESNPLISDLKEKNKILFDVCVHFIYDHGLQPFKNCNLSTLCKQEDYNAIVEVLDKAVSYFKHTPIIRDSRLFDISLVLKKSYSKGKNNGYKKRILKKNVGFSG